MGYQNYNNRGGYNGGYNNGGYNRNYGGYNNGGYPQQRYEPAPAPIPFNVGEMVRHRATNTELSVVRIGREQVECRLPDLTSQWFYVHELEAIEAK